MRHATILIAILAFVPFASATAQVPLRPGERVRVTGHFFCQRFYNCVVGRAYLFPAPIDRERPMRYELASGWLRRAEVLAKLPKQRGSLWHAYRRKWATERKHLPDADVAAAGGWKELESLRQCYQQADEATMLEVVLSGGQLRESKG